MPLEGSYNFTEKSDKLVLQVPLKGCAPSKVDIFVTSTTLKINFSPYLIDLVLRGAVDPVKHKAAVKDGVLQVTLLKANPGTTWGSLIADIADKKDLLAARQAALDDHAQLQDTLKQGRHDRRIDDERHALRKQMALDESARSLLENLKQEEKSEAEERIYKEFAEIERKNALIANSKEEALDRTAQKVKSAIGTGSSTVTNAANKAKPILQNADMPAAALTIQQSDQENSIFRASDIIEVSDVDSYLARDDIDEELAEEDEYSKKKSYSKNLQDIDDEDEEQPVRGTTRISKAAPPIGNAVHADDNDVDIKYVPPPRSAGYNENTRVQISYTPRIFPTPMRESKLNEEEDWIAKNRQHLKKNANLNKVGKNGGDITESDPNWLKAKGDDFFRTGDFRSAINAYSGALDADEYMTACLSNRSACYMKLGLHSECILDCKNAIAQIRNDPALLTSRTEGSSATSDYLDLALSAGRSDITPVANQLNKLYIRRGAAECMRGNYAEAIADYSLVLHVLEGVAREGVATGAFTTEGVKSDLDRLLTLSRAEALKKEADKILGEGNVKLALNTYTDALTLLPMHVGCLSNRSACKLALGDVQGCVDDCSAALALLQLDPTTASEAGGGINMLVSILPPAGSDKRTSWVVKTVTRRGAANAQLGQIDAAVNDYALAAGLDSKNEKLQSDLNNIRNHRAGLLDAKKAKEETVQC